MARPKLPTLKSRIPSLCKPSQGWADERRGTAKERGYGWAWTKLRNVVMQRDHGLCQPCKRRGDVALAQAVDHITPKSQGGTDDLSNLQAICDGPGSCHQAKTQAESQGREWDGQQLRRTGLDGWPK